MNTGIGDTRGIDEDTKNVQNIMSWLSNYQHLNGICLLLKPNDTRLTIFFRFCIKELLTHLHRSAVNKIIFCFTNARSTFYSPGETAQLLVELKQNTGIDVPFNKQNTFCFDNESFRFVAACKQGINFNDRTTDDFEKSWNTSVEQTINLIKRINQFAPHHVTETLSLNEARRLIHEIARPIAEITRNIQTNITVLNEKITELNTTKYSIADLSKKLRIPTVDLKCVYLPYPRTVCTANTCRRCIKFEDQVKIDYNTRCHEHCYLQGVAQNVVNNSALQKCGAMNQQGICTHCRCRWNMHMHISYETEQVRVEVIDKSIEAQIKTKEGAAAAIRRHKQNLEKRIYDLRQEQQR
jgi:hypothetical protein